MSERETPEDICSPWERARFLIYNRPSQQRSAAEVSFLSSYYITSHLKGEDSEKTIRRANAHLAINTLFKRSIDNE